MRNYLRISAWYRLLIGSSTRSCPGITRWKALSKFLMQNNLVQVIIRFIIIQKQCLNQFTNSFLFQDSTIVTYSHLQLFMLQVSILSLVALLIISFQAYTAEITLSNLKAFFTATYDRDNDGSATLKQFVDYFQFMEPQHDLTDADISPIHQFFDADQDKKVTLKELIQVAQVKVTTNTGNKQIHIGFTAEEAEMQVMWVSTPEFYNKPIVQYGRLPTALKFQQQGTFTTYDVGHFGFHGRIYKAVMKNLEPLKTYYYRVGDAETRTFSKIKHFKAPPLRVQQLQQISMAVFGDMGTFAPFGHLVMKQIAKDHFIKPLDFVFLTGDIAYAGMNSEKIGEFEPIWDLFGQLSESFAAYTAFMPGVGNHQKYYNYTAYSRRYCLPRKTQNQTNLWFSFDYGQVHMVHFSSQHPYTLTSQQYQYLDADLAAARSNPNIQWIILGVHRFFYSSSTFEHANVTNLASQLEDLVNKHKVDIVQTGHVHDYQRSWPTFKGKAFKERANKTHYVNPSYPVYVVQGTAGALGNRKFVSPTPQWSAKVGKHYGYGRITIKGNQLKYQFITIPGGRVHDEWHIIKDLPSSITTNVDAQ